jgi:hypothetical protein
MWTSLLADIVSFQIRVAADNACIMLTFFPMRFRYFDADDLDFELRLG